MNYPLRAAVLDFMHGHTDAYALRDFLDGQRLNYPEPMYACLMNLMGSHDVERLRTNLSSDIDVKTLQRSEQASFAASPEADERAAKLEKLCAAIQFSLPGVPSIYYGDELGMTGCRDPFNRLPLREGSRSPLEFYKKLSGIRRNNIMSTYAVSFAACGPDVLLISRVGGGREILTAVNRSGSPRPVFAGKAGVDLISGEQTAGRFVLPPYTAVILRLE
jgi:4-alpha-glucanotransferase